MISSHSDGMISQPSTHGTVDTVMNTQDLLREVIQNEETHTPQLLAQPYTQM